MTTILTETETSTITTPEHPTEVKDSVLARALDLLRRHGWVRGTWRNQHGMCLVTAVNSALGNAYDDNSLGTRQALTKLGFEGALVTEAVTWNDNEERTWEEVEERLERGAYGL